MSKPSTRKYADNAESSNISLGPSIISSVNAFKKQQLKKKKETGHDGKCVQPFHHLVVSMVPSPFSPATFPSECSNAEFFGCNISGAILQAMGMDGIFGMTIYLLITPEAVSFPTKKKYKKLLLVW